MKMVRAVVRPEQEQAIITALANNGFSAMTKWDVLGRGKQRGIQVGSQVYDELAKIMILIVVDDHQIDPVIKTIMEAGFTGFPGDGKLFVTPVEAAYTLRTGKAEL
jgi:nitrogen regulatory protein PII 1